MMNRLSPTWRAATWDSFGSWGSAPLHPRLYAIAPLRGLIKVPRCTTTHGGTLENPQNQSTASVRLSEQMRTELLWTTVIFRSINDLQTPSQLELEHIEAKR